MLRGHSASISTFILKEVRTNNGEGWNTTPHRYFRTVQWFLYAWHCFLTVPVSWNDAQLTNEDFVRMMLSQRHVLWGAYCFNTTTFLLNSWAGLFKVVYPRLCGMSWWNFTVSMNSEFLAKFTLGGNVAVVLIKWFYGKSTLCTSPRLHFKLNAIHGHTTWQHRSPSLITLKTEKRRSQIAQFTGGPCTSVQPEGHPLFLTAGLIATIHVGF